MFKKYEYEFLKIQNNYVHLMTRPMWLRRANNIQTANVPWYTEMRAYSIFESDFLA